MELTIPVSVPKALSPTHFAGRPPSYCVLGGLVFIVMSDPYLNVSMICGSVWCWLDVGWVWLGNCFCSVLVFVIVFVFVLVWFFLGLGWVGLGLAFVLVLVLVRRWYAVGTVRFVLPEWYIFYIIAAWPAAVVVTAMMVHFGYMTIAVVLTLFQRNVRPVDHCFEVMRSIDDRAERRTGHAHVLPRDGVALSAAPRALPLAKPALGFVLPRYHG